MAFDYTPYENKRLAYDEGLAGKRSANVYANFLAKQRGSRKMSDLERTQQRAVPRAVSGFSQRGLAGPGVRSGVYQRGMQDLATGQFTERQDLQDLLNDQLEQLRSNESDFEAQYKRDIADLEAQKATAQAQAAATLSAFKPYMGS